MPHSLQEGRRHECEVFDEMFDCPNLLQVFVETLDKCFENVCELDLIFHMDKVSSLHTLPAFILAGLNSLFTPACRYTGDSTQVFSKKKNEASKCVGCAD